MRMSYLMREYQDDVLRNDHASDQNQSDHRRSYACRCRSNFMLHGVDTVRYGPVGSATYCIIFTSCTCDAPWHMMKHVCRLSAVPQTGVCQGSNDIEVSGIGRSFGEGVKCFISSLGWHAGGPVAFTVLQQ